jgi:hypothetical protein
VQLTALLDREDWAMVTRRHGQAQLVQAAEKVGAGQHRSGRTLQGAAM